MNQQFTQILQMQETRRNPLLVLVDGEEYEEFEYLKSVKGKFFGIVFDESAIYTGITDAGDEKEAFAGVGG